MTIVKRHILLAICLMAAVLTCKGQGTDSKPMFVYYLSPSYMQMVYWTDIDKPDRQEYATNDMLEYYGSAVSSWALQNSFREHASEYTKFLMPDGTMKDVRYIGETLTDPDGKMMSYGELHGRESIPSPGLKYAFVQQPSAAEQENMWGMFIVVTDDYLKTHRCINMSRLEVETPLPQHVIRQLEAKYRMKCERSEMGYKGTRLSYGVMQFKGPYKMVEEYGSQHHTALALEVFIDGDRIYSLPVEGYYDVQDGPTWNVDDDGEYRPSSVMAFEGADGVDFCYMHGAPESITVGMMHLRNGKVIEEEYCGYHSLVDEQAPLWLADVAQMQQLYNDAGPHDNRRHQLNKYCYQWIDDDGTEEIWMRTLDDKHGALFTRHDGQLQLVGCEDEQRKLSLRQSRDGVGYAVISGPLGGQAYTLTEVFEIKNSQVIHRFTLLEQYGDTYECTYDGNTISNEEGERYLRSLPPVTELNMYFEEVER